MIFIACLTLCSGASAATVTGDIFYSFEGVNRVVPFSMNEGEEVVVTDTIKETPYVESISRGKEVRSLIREGGEFKLRIKPISGDRLMASYSIKMNHLVSMRHVAGIDIPDSRGTFSQGRTVVARSEKTIIAQGGDAVVSIVVN